MTGRDRPNVVLILADDMGFAGLGCMGSEIRTPNIDALAACGVTLSAGNRPMVARLSKLYEAWAAQVGVVDWSVCCQMWSACTARVWGSVRSIEQ